MYIDNELSGLDGRFKKLRKKLQAPIKKTIAVAKKSVAVQRKIMAPALKIHKRVHAPALKVTKKIVKRAIRIHEKLPMTKFMIKHQAKVGKILRPIAKVVAFVPGWIGMIGGALIALDKVSAARRAKKLQERQNATSEAEIARIDAEIAAIEAGGTPIDGNTQIPPVEAPMSANAMVGAQTAFTNAGGGYGAPGGDGGEGAPDETKPAEKKPVPWGLIAAGALTALTML